jgi:hypothetical protein
MVVSLNSIHLVRSTDEEQRPWLVYIQSVRYITIQTCSTSTPTGVKIYSKKVQLVDRKDTNQGTKGQNMMKAITLTERRGYKLKKHNRKIPFLRLVSLFFHIMPI